MESKADLLLAYENIKKQVYRWRILAIIAIIVVIANYGNPPSTVADVDPNRVYEESIARITFDGIIEDTDHQRKIIEHIRDQDKIKALIVRVDSPGSTAVAGEEVFNLLREVGEKKPIVTVMESMAASGGYMVSLAGDHILAKRGTLTGSIGVIFEGYEVTELANKLGIGIVQFKSADLKGSPTMFEKVTPRLNSMMNEVIQDSYQNFLSMILSRRKLDQNALEAIADGRIFTGNQALKLNLVDGIGGEKEARSWLEKEKQIKPDLKIIDIDIYKKENKWEEFLAKAPLVGNFFSSYKNSSKGLMFVTEQLNLR